MVSKGASDLHITAGARPRVRVSGQLYPLEDMPKLTPEDCKSAIEGMMTQSQIEKLHKNQELDLSFGMKGVSRFRGNIFFQRGAIAATFRTIPFILPDRKKLGLPITLFNILNRPSGMVLVTGTTGSGKTTTLASMIDFINKTRAWHIVTIEDPIEYIFPHRNSLINQREVGGDTESFSRALKYALRQDPDVVMVGEMRDFETISASLTLAETFHLTLATLHTNNAVQTINRIIDVFPPAQQSQIRTQISFVLQAVISQVLIPHINGEGRVLISELLIPNQGIRNLIREGKFHQIESAMMTGQSHSYMYTFNQCIAGAFVDNKITEEDAYFHSNNADELGKLITKYRKEGVPALFEIKD